MFECTRFILEALILITCVGIYAKLHCKKTSHCIYTNPKSQVFHLAGCHHIGDNATELEICDHCLAKHVGKKALNIENSRVAKSHKPGRG